MHCPHLAELLVLIVIGLQHASGVSGWEIPGKRAYDSKHSSPVYGVPLVGLGSA